MDVTMVDIYVLLVVFGVSLVLGGILAGVSCLLKAAYDRIREELKK
nr:MAG TPA: Lipopolysaccharide assembly protein A domain [Caudoviricetes sp.]